MIRGRVVRGAHVPAPVAVWLLRRLDDTDVANSLAHYRSTHRGAAADLIERTLAELRCAAAEHMRDQAVISESGSTEAGTTEITSRSKSTGGGLLGARAAAGLLGLKSERRVLQLIADELLAAEKIDGRWLIRKSDLEEYRALRATRRTA